MDTLLTIVALGVMAVWAVLWVVATAALVANEPKLSPRPWTGFGTGLGTGSTNGSFRPTPRGSRS